MKILPSPILPEYAAFFIASVTFSAFSSSTITSKLHFNKKFIIIFINLSIPPVEPLCLPKPFTSETVIPEIPTSCKASLTNDNLNGLILLLFFHIVESPINCFF